MARWERKFIDRSGCLHLIEAVVVVDLPLIPG